ncbi:GTP-binding protein [Sphingomonas sp. SCN 67-18]|uniref:CobW family GTP-binding protein n=1 Tax=uncultured Sphingomonas sp. TaxID=158754 RepID=UPI000B31CA10|nr:GTP-binding protein [Sphingomonas sp. SCN 67-18]
MDPDKPKRDPSPRTPVTIVTGFLGSGKTTLMNRALADPAMRGALVVINEFGEVGLDHALMTACDDSIVVLENGCLCCTVFGDLIGTLNALYHRREAGEIDPFDRVVIETSGLADPVSVVQAFLSDPTLEGLYRLGGVVSVVDGINYAATLREHDEAVRQIALADHVILTKLDLMSAETRAADEVRARAAIAAINHGAPVIDAGAADLDLAPLLGWDGHDLSRGAADVSAWLAAGEACDDDGHHHAHGHHHHHHHDDDRDHMAIGSLSFVREEPLPRLALQLLLEGIERNLGSSLLRIKAIVAVEGEEDGPAVIQGAQHLLHNVSWLESWPFPDRKSRFVLIAAGIGTGALREMVELLDRIATRSATARASG